MGNFRFARYQGKWESDRAKEAVPSASEGLPYQRQAQFDCSIRAKENKMTGIAVALRWVARLDGIVALILGIILWAGSPGLLKIHILTGFIMSITMLLIGLVGFFARVKPALPIIAIVWAPLLPYVGFAQLKLFPGGSHIVIQVIHLIIGVCAIGIAEALVAKIARQSRA
jgi:hypothetical protein